MTTKQATTLLLLFVQSIHASVSIYHTPQQSQLSVAAAASAAAASGTATAGPYVGLAAYNTTILNAPPPPAASTFPTQITLQLTDAPMLNVSIPQKSSFFGFSVEMSVVNQVLGKNASFLQVPFLNLMANLQQRTGRIDIRVGGNTQETATLVDSTPDGKILEKDLAGATNPTQTPPLVFTAELLYMLRNISEHINIRWHLGVPFNDTSNFRLAIAEQGQAILGDYLIGLQVGNEPDLYAQHGHRPSTYGPQDYFNDFGAMIQAMKADEAKLTTRPETLLIGPSVQVIWTPDEVWSTGFIDAYTENLAFLSVERYPSDNCAAAFNTGAPIHNPQDIIGEYLSHGAVVDPLALYSDSTALAIQKGKPFLMFETNSASCGGFPGISDAFTGALWGVDWAMQLAATNFTGALFHVGGQSVSYNPFTPPPTNESTFHQWTVGPTYYSALVVSEAIGASNTSQVLDLQHSAAAVFAPNFTPLPDQLVAYGIWENGHLARVLYINYVTDTTNQSDVTVTMNLDQPNFQGNVQVKYLRAPTVAQKGNYTWAGQTFGGNFQSDGRPIGNEDIQTVACASATQCLIKVPAPAAALVFLSPTGGQDADQKGAPQTTFATTAVTIVRNTASIDPSVLATSNGRSGALQIGSTSPEATKNAAATLRVGLTMVMGGMLGGAAWLMMA
ncbi:glycoside hydrolase family 79 protein [Agrocybe pediades]|nr:glycoside hydrolase family 79 protein [Agrocybe pediades]